jgi:hypothetical protein
MEEFIINQQFEKEKDQEIKYKAIHTNYCVCGVKIILSRVE